MEESRFWRRPVSGWQLARRPPVCRHGKQCGQFWCRNAALFIYGGMAVTLVVVLIYFGLQHGWIVDMGPDIRQDMGQ